MLMNFRLSSIRMSFVLLLFDYFSLQGVVGVFDRAFELFENFDEFLMFVSLHLCPLESFLVTESSLNLLH